MRKPAGDLHQVSDAEMHEQSTGNRSRLISYHAQEDASKIRTDTLSERLAKMNGTVKSSHWQYGIFANKSHHSENQQSPEKKFNGDKVQAIGNLEKQLEWPAADWCNGL